MSSQEERPRFVIDAMLGTLAKWLRLLGYDTLYSPSYNDAQIISMAARMKRAIVTSDKGLYRRAAKAGVRAILLPEANVTESLARLATSGLIELKVDPSRSRCPLCNGVLREVTDKNAIRGRVPPGALTRYNKFYVCTRCGHVYWEGGHWRNIRRIVEEAKLLTAQLTGQEGATASGP
ncbi:MAG: Mut7-C RNAse domain-containing protein [Acidilobus sp.]